MALVKSHSNYVLKKKHQEVSDGTIWERDITTIGGVNFFAPGQTPIFRDNNFIITVRNDGNIANQYNSIGWKDSVSGSTLWTLETISAITSEFEDQNDTKIVIKNDYYDFCDFAYYGSLSELFRTSITDIINRFPGELYGSTDNVFYTAKVTSGTSDGEDYPTESFILGGDESFHELKNPFGIDIHSEKVPIGANPLKYFAEGGYSAYTYNGGEITYERHITGNCASTNETLGTVTINGHVVYVYIGNEGSIHYLHKDMDEAHITPNSTYLAAFYNECDSFQKLLMNPNTNPKYKAEFSVIKEDDYGYHREMKTFIFPTSDGGYNIDATGYGFNNYTRDLSAIGELYDEVFTDNLWRSMTHEAIKNFDWTYTREYTTGEEEEYVLGGEKVQKALRVFAREFDEIKTYIDNITSVNRITYDDRANIPNYFLTDVCEDEGWDIVQVIPYNVTLNGTVCDANTFIQNTKKEIKPYNSTIKAKDGTTNLKNGYFIGCCSSAGTAISNILCEYGSSSNYYVKVAGPNKSTFYDECADRIINRIKSYSDSAATYTYMDVNNEFLRRLKLNSRYIWRHKGTIDGIEMVLALFGMKSKRWFCAQEDWKKKNCYGDESCEDSSNWDYEVTEYTRFTNGIVDPWDNCHNMNKYNWVNSTKNITYDYRTVSAYNSRGTMGITYIPYQGLPVSYYDKNETRYLYPNFNKSEQYDGNPYFQMNGGWLSKKITDGNTDCGFQFDNDNAPVYDSGGTIYKETVRNIRRVENLHGLISIPSSQVEKDSLCYVEDLTKKSLIVDGEVFDIKTDSYGDFVTFIRRNGMITVGDKFFDTKISVYGRNGEIYEYTLDDKLDGYPVNAYIYNGAFHCSNGNYSIDLYNIFDPTTDGSYSNYFILSDPAFSNSVAVDDNGNGWRRLRKTSNIYKKINTIWNYYNGNNPHSGGLKYDNGEEYYEYFKHIFKYAYENDLFDERCYNDYYDEIDNVYSAASFSIGNDNPDKKIHYFGNYKTKGGTKYTYGNSGYVFINTGNPYTSQLNSDSVTNQIINNKRLTIKFKIDYPYNDENGQAKLKFIDEIVMNYLTQVIPSTTIVDIRYEFTSIPSPSDVCCNN